jgi:cytochrome c oxidase accessory protein FixG
MSATETPTQVTLYERWQKIHPLWLKGGFQKGRRVVLSVLVAVYYVGAWLSWNGQPMFWFNLPDRQFTVFGVAFWPQEFVLLSWLLMMAAFGLFVVTVIAGRVWCGWACPQTVWALVYFWIERKVEGTRTQRLRLDKGPWDRRRIGRKLVKWTLWAVVALSISFTFVAYFLRPEVLIAKITSFSLTPWEQLWLLLPAGASFLMSGVLREQVCFHMCPYARFQSVMFDRNTLIISYDAERGDPRGHRPRQFEKEATAAPAATPATTPTAAQALGDCVDCKRCVHACPTGIDIRDGLQYECIACAACIDACNDVMGELGQAPDLIRYSSQHADSGEHVSWMRPRLAGYGAVMSAILVSFVWVVGHRVPLELDIIRDRGRLYREHWDGSVENAYSLRITNRESRPRRYEVRAEADFPIELNTRRGPVVEIDPGEQLVLSAQLVSQGSAEADSNRPVRFIVETTDEPRFTVREESRFLQPSGGGEQ